MLQSAEMLPYLQQEDILQMQQYFASIQGGRASYTDFYPLAKEIILRVYRVKDPSEVVINLLFASMQVTNYNNCFDYCSLNGVS